MTLKDRRFIYPLLILTVLVLALAVGCATKQPAPEPEPAPEQPAMVEEYTPPAPEPAPEPMKPEPMPEPEPMAEMVQEYVDVFFAFDDYSLTSEARETLARNADIIKAVPGASILIEGHCDERGTNEYNLGLGERRANSAKNYLVSLGVSASSIETRSYGEERPFAMGHNEQAWSQNRRAHFVVK